MRFLGVHGRGPPPPPPRDPATRLLEDMAKLLEQVQQAPKPQVDIFEQFRCAIYILRDDASFWWEGAAHAVDLDTLTWAMFKELFYGKYFSADVRGCLKREFMSLRQGDSSMAEFIRKFDRGCHFMSLIARDARKKLRHFMDGMRPTLRRDVMLMRPTSYDEATSCAFQVEKALRDIDFEVQKKQFSGPLRQ
ncbi:uncharacterized protein LOC142554641 [Primulina tabacum]|uniref:uncharacterized protein LOC142554641 n=1 Tax=Primulina tabacum TaxID=48773 RepID=UPI003F595B0A